jgi:RNA polymerase sigma factor (sigma-70 family)
MIGHTVGAPDIQRDVDLEHVGDSELLVLARTTPRAFAVFYRRHVREVQSFFRRRVGSVETAFDLTAETFAAALVSRARYRPASGAAVAWLFGIAVKKLADAQRRGWAEQRARRRLGMERIELSQADIVRIELLGEQPVASALVELLAPDQRDAVRAHVVDDRSYAEIATDLEVSEAVVRKRVSRGLATVRERMGNRR